MRKNYIFLYLLFCLIGAGLEWGYGAFWNVVGTTPWIYPDSPIHYTSLEGLPLWGLGGFIIVAMYKAISWRKAKHLLGMIPPMILGVLWIIVYSSLIA